MPQKDAATAAIFESMRQMAVNIADEFDTMDADDLRVQGRYLAEQQFFGQSRTGRMLNNAVVEMAMALSKAKELRLAGKINDALRYERVADKIYKSDISGARMENPRLRKSAIRRKGVTGSKYVTRRSQMTGKPPTKRLKKRRAKAVAAPKKGYFPNPGKVRVIRENPAPLVYYVHPLVDHYSGGQYEHGGRIAPREFDRDAQEQWVIASGRTPPKKKNLFLLPTERMDMKAFRLWYRENHKKYLVGSYNDLRKVLGQFVVSK